MFWEEFLSRLSQGAAVAEGGAVSHTRNQLETAVRAKRSIEAIELIPEVCNELDYMYVYMCVVEGSSSLCMGNMYIVCMYMKVRFNL